MWWLGEAGPLGPGGGVFDEVVQGEGERSSRLGANGRSGRGLATVGWGVEALTRRRRRDLVGALDPRRMETAADRLFRRNGSGGAAKWQ